MCSQLGEGWTNTKPLCKEVHGGAAKASPNLCSVKNPGGELVPWRPGKVIKQRKKFGGNLPAFVTGFCTDCLWKGKDGG